jgi:Family of unknown function (DUF5522)
MSDNDELIFGEDYYTENGRWVFTAKFLLNRGYCCRSGCRHCPYGYIRQKEQQNESPIKTSRESRE